MLYYVNYLKFFNIACLMMISVMVSSVFAKDTFMPARTIFEISDHEITEQEVEVRRGESAFLHNIRYQGEAVLGGEYIDEKDKVYPKGLRLFKIEIEEYDKAYCGLAHFKMLGGDAVKARCFIDVDNDGVFDQVHAGIGNYGKPFSVNLLRTRRENRPSHIPYEIISDNDKRTAGQLWFGIRNKRQKPHGLGIYVKSDDYEQFMYKSFVSARMGTILEFKGSKIEVTGFKKRKTKLQIDKAIETGSTFELSSVTETAFLIPITVSAIE